MRFQFRDLEGLDTVIYQALQLFFVLASKPGNFINREVHPHVLRCQVFKSLLTGMLYLLQKDEAYLEIVRNNQKEWLESVTRTIGVRYLSFLCVSDVHSV